MKKSKMDLNVQLQECFEKLGYHSAFPTLHVNPSTCFVWQQFVNNVKPRDEVDVCRKNIIINRLKRKPNIKDPVEFPVREIQVYEQLKTVEEDIEKTKSRIKQKQNKELLLCDATKATYLINESMKQKIQENKIKLHALQLKSKSIEAEVKQAEELINSEGLELVSVKDGLPSETVLKLLQNLTERIFKLTQPQISMNTSQVMVSRNSKKTCLSSIKKSKISSKKKFGSCMNINSAKSLFGESFKENDANTENILDQSAGILPDSCFDFIADEEFLTSRQIDDEKLFLRSESLLETSVNYHGQFALQSVHNPRPRQKQEYFEQAYSNKYVAKGVEELLRTANTKIIWDALCFLREDLLRNIRLNLESSKEQVRFKNNLTNDGDITKLHYIHIKNNLLHLESRKRIKILTDAIKEKKSNIQQQLAEHVSENRLQDLDLLLENVKLEAAIRFMQKEISNNRKIDNGAELRSVNAKISKAKDDLLVKIKDIEGYIESKEDLIQKMKKCQSDTITCVRKLSKFTCDSDWAAVLTENVQLNEMQAFGDFPLDYNKNFCFTSKDTFYRDTVRNIMFDEVITSDVMHMITSVLEHPQNPPEQIFANILRKRNKVDVLASLNFPRLMIKQNDYSLSDLQKQEDYIQSVCETFMSYIKSPKAHQVLNSSAQVRQTMDLWLEMPFKRYISQERIVNGKTYKQYEESFEYLRDNK